MRWFQRKRLNLGVYDPPKEVPPAPVAQIAKEGALIGESVVRLTLRNRVIVDALRERADLDLAVLERLAATELETLADHEWESAERIRIRRDLQRTSDDYDSFDLERLQESLRRESVHRAMSEEFAVRAADAAALASLVERSRAEAWSEIAPVLIARAGEHQPAHVVDPHYDEQRPDRLAALVALDLTELAHERGVTL